MNTALLSHINWLAVIVASVAYFMIGGLWYSKALFGSKWATLQKIDMNDPNMKKGVAAMMFYSFLLMLVNVIGLAIFTVRLDLTIISSGVKLGVMAGLFFSVTAVSISFIYERKPTALHFITGGYLLAGNIVAAVILAAWR
ncbi:MAG: DUF1761 domain-containing protein [Bacteroidota bacterium]